MTDKNLKDLNDFEDRFIQQSKIETDFFTQEEVDEISQLLSGGIKYYSEKPD